MHLESTACFGHPMNHPSQSSFLGQPAGILALKEQEELTRKVGFLAAPSMDAPFCFWTTQLLYLSPDSSAITIQSRSSLLVSRSPQSRRAPSCLNQIFLTDITPNC